MIGAAGWNERAARAWCERMAGPLRRQQIERDGRPYLDRYFLEGGAHGERRSPAVFLHHFLASDARAAVHSHPWDFAIAVILVGGYLEQRLDPAGAWSSRRCEPGSVNVIDGTTRHRVELIGADCWSLFLAGSYAQAWTFWPVPASILGA